MGLHNIQAAKGSQPMVKDAVAIKADKTLGFKFTKCPLPTISNNYSDVVAYILLLAAGQYNKEPTNPYHPAQEFKAVDWTRMVDVLLKKACHPFLNVQQYAQWMFVTGIGES